MKKAFFIFMILICAGCDSEDSGDCFQKSGETIRQEVSVAAFTEIMVYDKIKLIIVQGESQQVIVETGKNLLNDIVVEVKNGRLSLKNENRCNLFREYGITKIYVETPHLEYLRHAGNIAIESDGVLEFEDLWLVSENQAKDMEVYTNGDFILQLKTRNLRITSDNYSNFFLSGTAENVDAFFAAGDARLEARELIVQNYELFHRGTNKLIVNPQQSLKGDIYSYGDIISVNRPPVVDVEEHFRGKLIFE